MGQLHYCVTYSTFLHVFIFTDKYEVGTYYWICPIDQDLSLRNKGHLLMQEYFGTAKSEDSHLSGLPSPTMLPEGSL